MLPVPISLTLRLPFDLHHVQTAQFAAVHRRKMFVEIYFHHIWLFLFVSQSVSCSQYYLENYPKSSTIYDNPALMYVSSSSIIHQKKISLKLIHEKVESDRLKEDKNSTLSLHECSEHHTWRTHSGGVTGRSERTCHVTH